jgi:hypothetical protein
VICLLAISAAIGKGCGEEEGDSGPEDSFPGTADYSGAL